MTDPYALIQEWEMATGCASPRHANDEFMRLRERVDALESEQAQSGGALRDFGALARAVASREPLPECRTAGGIVLRDALLAREQAEKERDDALQRARLAAGAHVEAVQRSEHNEDAVRALRERVRELENNLDEASEQGREWLRERDEARAEAAAAFLAGKAEAREDVERAEADNAALEEAFTPVVVQAAHPDDETRRPMRTLIENASLVLNRPHPGAAMLERLRALERVREACEPWVQHYRKGMAMTEEGQRVIAACAAADALKDLDRRLVDEQCALTARAEQAERERDEALKRARLAAGAHLEAVQRSEHNEDAARALRERVKELENSLDEASEQGREWLRERDEARRIHGKAVLEGSAAVARAERAEANNAALSEVLRYIERWVNHDGGAEHLPRHLRLKVATALGEPSNPGAALLERLRALERVILTVYQTAGHAPGGSVIIGKELWESIAALVHAADALKGQAKASPAPEAQPEPSTAEAFATVRRGWQVMESLKTPGGHSGDEESGQHDEDCALCAHEALLAWSEDAAHALSLLERRMGEVERALRLVESDLYHERFATAEGRVKDLLAALTDAPDVFTREEVEREARVALDDVGYLMERLDALRKR